MTTATKLDDYSTFCAHACMGAECVHRHAFGGMLYTSGVKFTADLFGAHWLIDLIASHQPNIKRKLQRLGLRDFQVWRLHKVGDGEDWSAEAWSDAPGESGGLLARQVFGYSDFPAELLPFLDFWVEGGTLMLKQER